MIKSRGLIGILVILLMISCVFATELKMPETKLKLLPRSSDWGVIENNANGWIILNNAPRYGNQIEARAIGLKKYTFYTLVYSEQDEQTAGKHTEVYCIDKLKTNNLGNMKIKKTQFDYSAIVNKEVRFWMVLSSDVNCRKNYMTAWNPSKYLFSNETI